LDIVRVENSHYFVICDRFLFAGVGHLVKQTK
jgi:hypothetical protein